MCKLCACLTWPVFTSYLVVYMLTFQSILMVLDWSLENVIPITLFFCLKYLSRLPHPKHGLHCSGWSGSFMSVPVPQPWFIFRLFEHSCAVFSASLTLLMLYPLMEYSHLNPYTSFEFQIQYQCLRKSFWIAQTRLSLSVTYSHSNPFISLHIVAFLLNCL